MIEKLKTEFEVEQKSEILYKIVIDIENLESTMLKLINTYEYITLDSINCRDDIEDGKFCITYILQTSARDHVLMLQTYINREDASLPTMHTLFPQAEIMERDLHEMFGIDFPGHPSLIDFVLEYWEELPPLRRDFDTLEFVNKMNPFRDQRNDNLDVKVEMKKRREEKKAKKAKAEAEAKAKAEKENPTKEVPNNE